MLWKVLKENNFWVGSLVVMGIAAYYGNWLAFIGYLMYWTTRLITELEIKIHENYHKTLEEDRDKWHRKYIELKYGKRYE